jgi:predicted Zn-dependent protease
MYGAELISGYGRDMELEADGLGAEYMYKAGYDPEALLDVIGVLKNQEQFMRLKAREKGKSGTTYHGLYATHPRNDKRLQTVIRAANELDDGTYIESPEVPGEFRRVTDGLVWGESVGGQRADDRYYHNKLGFTFEQPEGWAWTSGAQAVVAACAGRQRRGHGHPAPQAMPRRRRSRCSRDRQAATLEAGRGSCSRAASMATRPSPAPAAPQAPRGDLRSTT